MPTIHVGNAPCSWGTLEFEGLHDERVPYERMLDELVETGYAGTELGDWGYFPTDPVALSGELSRRRVALLGAFVPVALKYSAAHAEGESDALRAARLLAATTERLGSGHRPVIVLADDNGADAERTKHAGRISPDMGLSAAEWGDFARGAERIARRVRVETGLSTVFHHHCAGYVETPDEIARLLDMTDSDLLGLVLDTGHYVYGSGQPDGGVVLEAFARFGDRIPYVHLKDCDARIAETARREGWDYFAAIEHGVFCELGRGCVDFAAVVDALRHRGYEGWVVVEQDVLPGMGAPKASAQRNRQYLCTLGL